MLLHQVIKHFFELWYWDSKPNLVRRLMRLLLTRQLMDAVHPCGQTYGQVGVVSQLKGACDSGALVKLLVVLMCCTC